MSSGVRSMEDRSAAGGPLRRQVHGLKRFVPSPQPGKDQCHPVAPRTHGFVRDASKDVRSSREDFVSLQSTLVRSGACEATTSSAGSGGNMGDSAIADDTADAKPRKERPVNAATDASG